MTDQVDVTLHSPGFQMKTILEIEPSCPVGSQDVTQRARSLCYSVITLFNKTGNVM